jgi:glycosyltransferase involved in cell wall biosynthesis
MGKPKLSIVCRFRSEYPILLSTMYSLFEDALASGYPFELIMVDNMSDDMASDVLEDRFRRWTKDKTLKVVRYTEKASTWCAINAGWAAADGDILVVADAHISVRRGTLALLANGAAEHGGIWHPAVQLWGDTEEIVNGYGFDLRLCEKFWGNPCRYPPPDRKRGDVWKIPMAGACLYAVSREEVTRYGLYHPAFRAYGGGEPYLAMKWWLNGSSVWCHSGGLVRHAFGIKATWKTAPENGKPHRNAVWTDRDRATKTPAPGERYLSYSSGYKPPSSTDYCFNFALAALLIGGERWMDNTIERLLRGADGTALRADIVAEAGPERHAGLDALLADPPWERCEEHDQEPALEEWRARNLEGAAP